jgi:DoxX-like family
MELAMQSAPTSKKMLWAGWVIGTLPALLLIASAVGKLTKADAVVEGFTAMGWNPDLARGLGVVELLCAIIYLVPQTSVLGAILLTGYMGGAIATHVRLGEAIYTQTILGVLFWLGLYLRDARIRALLPLRS